MEEIKHMTQEDVNAIVKNFPLQPTFNRVLITLNTDVEEDGLIISTAGLSETQYVVAKGPNCQFLAGSKVLIDLDKLSVKRPSDTDQAQMTTQIKIDPVQVDGVTYTFIEDRYIKAVDNR
jgi:hypothetical protein